MKFRTLINKSRSYRRFHEDYKISKKTLLFLINLARLSPSTANLQPLKFIISYKPKDNSLIFPALTWAGYLKDWHGPKKGEKPSAYIIILGDKNISGSFQIDSGIACMSILLGAVSIGLGGCIMGSLDRNILRKNWSIPLQYEILLVIALGRPKEKVIIEDAVKGNIKYYRDAKGVHHVPKRPLSELIFPFL